MIATLMLVISIFLSMQKILFIHHSSSWGGSINSLVELITSLDKRKFSPTVLLIKDSSLTDVLKEKNIEFVVAQSLFYRKFYQFFVHSEAGYVKWYQILKFARLNISWLLSRFIFAKKELANIDFDIAHLNSSVLTDWLAPCKSKGKTIIHIREPFRKGSLDLLHPLLRNQMKIHADRIIAISKDNANRVNLPDKTTIVYNYMSHFSIDIKKSSYASKKFLYLGGSSKIKGFYTMVEAHKFLDDNVKVIFAGNYSYLSKGNRVKRILKRIFGCDIRQKRAVKAIEDSKNYHIIGLSKDVSKLMKEVCCVVSPFYKPHFARPVIEAYLHKKPVIGSDIEGMDETIQHHKTGLLFFHNNSKELAKAINYMAKHPEEAKKMGEAGFKIAEKKFTSANVKQIEDVYLH